MTAPKKTGIIGSTKNASAEEKRKFSIFVSPLHSLRRLRLAHLDRNRIVQLKLAQKYSKSSKKGSFDWSIFAGNTVSRSPSLAHATNVLTYNHSTQKCIFSACSTGRANPKGFAKAGIWCAHMLRHNVRPRPCGIRLFGHRFCSSLAPCRQISLKRSKRKTALPRALRQAIVDDIKENYSHPSIADFYEISVLTVKQIKAKKDLWEGADEDEVAEFRENGSVR